MEGAAAMVAAEAANPSNVDIDALPYVDQQMETIEQMKAYVDHLVAEEMKTFAPRDYLSHLPEPELKFLERPMLKAELERVQAGGEMAQMDTSRYAVAPPSGEQASDPAAWKAAISNAKAQLEQQVEDALMRLEGRLGEDQRQRPPRAKVQPQQAERGHVSRIQPVPEHARPSRGSPADGPIGSGGGGVLYQARRLYQR